MWIFVVLLVVVAAMILWIIADRMIQAWRLDSAQFKRSLLNFLGALIIGPIIAWAVIFGYTSIKESGEARAREQNAIREERLAQERKVREEIEAINPNTKLHSN